MDEITQLKLDKKQLEEKLQFMNKIFEHPTAQVYQMQEANINGKPIWINTQVIQLKELQKLDKTEMILKLIQEKTNVRYSDKW